MRDGHPIWALICGLSILLLSSAVKTAAGAEAAMTVRHVAINGRVQHVHYRLWTQNMASQLGLDGWVRNRRNGSVEAVVAGSPQAVTAAVAAFRQGPPKARVTSVSQRVGAAALLSMRRAGERFSILPTL